MQGHLLDQVVGHDDAGDEAVDGEDLCHDCAEAQKYNYVSHGQGEGVL